MSNNSPGASSHAQHSFAGGMGNEPYYILTELLHEMFPTPSLLASPGLYALHMNCGAAGWIFDVTRSQLSLRHRMGDLYPLLADHLNALTWVGSDSEHIKSYTRALLEMSRECFPPASFDLVNLSFVEGYVQTTSLSEVFRELVLICRPGGVLCWTEGELPETTSVACTQLFILTTRALSAVGRGFSHKGRRSEIMALMGYWLRDAGCGALSHRSLVLDISANAEAHYRFIRQMSLLADLVVPWLAKMKVETESELQKLARQVKQEILREQFTGHCTLYTVWGTVGSAT